MAYHEETPDSPDETPDYPTPIRRQAGSPNTGIVGPRQAYPAASPITQAASPATQGGFDRNAFRDKWMSSGGYGGNVKQFLTDNPTISQGITQVGTGGDKWRLPTGEEMDLVIDVGGANKAGWTGFGPSAGGGAGGAGGGSQAGQAGGQYSGLPSGAPNSVFDMLMKRASRDPNVDPNDPIVKAQTEAYGAQETKAMRDYLSSEAERAGSMANIGAERRSAAEQVGQRTGAFQGQLMQRELARRQGEIENALSGAAGFLTEQQRLQLQNELTRLQDATQRFDINRRASEFERELGQRESEFGRSDEFRRSPLAGPR